jgi:hypothetical protein
MQRYLEQEVTREFYRALSQLVMGLPSVRTYEVISGGDHATGWVSDESAADGGRR